MAGKNPIPDVRRFRPASTPLRAAVVLGLATAHVAVPQAHAQDAGDAIDPMYGPDAAIIDVTRRVIGGNVSTAGQFPSIVALLDAGLFSAADRQFCGGTVVADRWVLTAAHCMFDVQGRRIDSSLMRVVEGVVDLRNDPIDEEVLITNVFLHPEYDNAVQAAYNDLALLELGTALESPPAALFTQDPDDYSGQTAVVAGWGTTEYPIVAYASELHHASVPLVSQEACNAPDSYGGLVRAGQLCAGFVGGGVDGCLGDSGGPLFTGVNGRVELLGVVSFGKGCAEPNFYGIYTSVASYLDWIGQYLSVRTITPRDGGGQVTGAPAGDPARVDESDSGTGFGAAGLTLPALLGALLVWRRRLSRRRAGLAASAGQFLRNSERT